MDLVGTIHQVHWLHESLHWYCEWHVDVARAFTVDLKEREECILDFLRCMDWAIRILEIVTENHCKIAYVGFGFEVGFKHGVDQALSNIGSQSDVEIRKGFQYQLSHWVSGELVVVLIYTDVGVHGKVTSPSPFNRIEIEITYHFKFTVVMLFLCQKHHFHLFLSS